ncbi:MAG: mitofilin family membrane protein [Pseudomonadota bacterium]|nr:mitofilin family membrane protein [Pseudomonadota bacterium]
MNTRPNTASVERIINLFGGIRPMANKLNIPVSTVQGWKSRGVIPGARRKEIMAVAAAEGLEITSALLAKADSIHSESEPAHAEAPVETPVPTYVSPEQHEPVQAPAAPPAAPRVQKSRMGTTALTAAIVAIVIAATGPLWTPHLYGPPTVPAGMIALEHRLDALVSGKGPFEPDRVPITSGEIESRLDMFESHLEDVDRRLSSANWRSEIELMRGSLEQYIEETGEYLGTRIDTFKERQDSVKPRLDQLALRIDDIASVPQNIDALTGRVDTLASHMEPLAERMERALALVERIDRTPETRLLVALRLEQALKTGKSYRREAELLAALAGDDSDMLQALHVLEPTAESGVADMNELRTELARLAPEMLKRAFITDCDNWWEAPMKRMLALVSVKHAPGPYPGNDSLPARIARAEWYMERDNLDKAIKEIETLNGDVAIPVQGWLQTALARLEAMVALDVVHERVEATFNVVSTAREVTP